MTEQDVINAARDSKMWCKGHHIWGGGCNCPFALREDPDEICALARNITPDCWEVGEKHDD